MKRITVLICCLAVSLSIALMTKTVLAVSINIQDSYYGADDHGYGDVIGNAGLFGIDSMDVNIVGTTLHVDINTAFANRGDDMLFAGYTTNGKGIGYGDLFLSNQWNPDTSQSNYLADNHITGTKWTYGLKLDNNWGASGGTATLYELNGTTNDDNAILNDELFTGSVIFRNGQETFIDALSATTVALSNTATWSLSQGVVSFLIDISNTSLAAGNVALHWGATCANDTIEGFAQITPDPAPMTAPVPEPASIALLGIGFAGLAGAGARRKWKKKAAGNPG